MKKLLLFASLLTAFQAHSQLKDANSPPNIYRQLGNTGNVYGNVIAIPGGAGTLRDTTSGTTVLTLQNVSYGFSTRKVSFNGVAVPVSSGDTLIPSPISGSAYLSFYARMFKVTGTDTISFQPVQSYDGYVWVAIPGVSAVRVACTSLTVGQGASFTQISGLPILRLANYYGVQATGLGGCTSAVQAWIGIQERD